MRQSESQKNSVLESLMNLYVNRIVQDAILRDIFS